MEIEWVPRIVIEVGQQEFEVSECNLDLDLDLIKTFQLSVDGHNDKDEQCPPMKEKALAPSPTCE